MGSLHLAAPVASLCSRDGCAQAMGSYDQRLACVQIADNGERDAVQMITLCAGNGGSYDDRLNCLR